MLESGPGLCRKTVHNLLSSIIFFIWKVSLIFWFFSDFSKLTFWTSLIQMRLNSIRNAASAYHPEDEQRRSNESFLHSLEYYIAATFVNQDRLTFWSIHNSKTSFWFGWCADVPAAIHLPYSLDHHKTLGTKRKRWTELDIHCCTQSATLSTFP